MNLLENEMILGAVQMQNGNYQQALTRFVNTENIYPENSLLKSNVAVGMCLSQLDKQLAGQESVNKQSNYERTIKCLNQAILSAPLNYVGYYNMFNFLIKNQHHQQAFSSLIQAITALYLEKALSQQSQKILTKIIKQYCANSILVYLIKAIVHVKHQKYIIAITELNWIVENQHVEKNDKISALLSIKLIFEALEQNQKIQSTELKLQQLLKSLTPQNLSQNIKTQTKLTSTVLIPQNKQVLDRQFSKRLQQFSSLLKATQHSNFLLKNQNPQIIFKQVNSQNLGLSEHCKDSLFLQLKSEILTSPLYTKSESKQLSRSRKSQQIAVKHSQDFTLNQSNQLKPSLTSRKEDQNQHQMRLSLNLNRNEPNPLIQSKDIKKDKKLNSSLSSSGINRKIKTENIYPLSKIGQQVEVKLVMAQLTNNKELLGNMDPYCVINYNKTKKKSSVVKGGGIQPKWKESFMFKLTQQPSQVVIEVFDKQNFFKKDDFVGSGKFTLEKNGFIKIPLFQNEKQAGTIFVTIESKI